MHSIQPIVISRFLLNLRQIDRAAPQTGAETTNHIGDIDEVVFRTPTVMDSIIGNMGASMNDELFRDEVDEHQDEDHNEASNRRSRSRGSYSRTGSERVIEVCINFVVSPNSLRMLLQLITCAFVI